MKLVTSRENPAFKSVAKLVTSSSERRKRALAVLDGAHLVGAFLDSARELGREAPGGSNVHAMLVSRSALGDDEVAGLVARVPESSVVVVSDKLFESVSTVGSATGVLAVVPAPRGSIIPPGADLVLLLEGVQDPGNVGTLLRSAAAAGAPHVGLSPGCAFAWSPKTLRSGMGSQFALNVVEDFDLAAFLAAYRGTSVALAGGAGPSIHDVDLRGPVAIVVGNEGAGLTAAVRAKATVSAQIPMPGKAESLNAAVAGSIALFEAVRQRRGDHR